MPCGGIFPHLPIMDGERCYHCDEESTAERSLEYFVEEWDASIHRDCLDPFLKTEDGMLISEHDHLIERIGGPLYKKLAVLGALLRQGQQRTAFCHFDKEIVRITSRMGTDACGAGEILYHATIDDFVKEALEILGVELYSP